MGYPYIDAGAVATDDVDGDISDAIIVTGTIDSLQAGTYTLAYDVNDSSGNSAQTVTRTIQVIEMIYAETSITNDGVYADLTWDAMLSASWYHIVLANEANEILFDIWQETNSVCTGDDCKFEVDSDWLPFGLVSGGYRWYLQGWIDGDYTPWFFGTFNVEVSPPQALTVTVNPNQGRPTITWTDDILTLYMQIYIGQANGNILYQEWHKQSALCDGSICTLTPDINPLAGDYDIFVQPWGPGGFLPNDMGGWIGPIPFSLSDSPPEPVTGMTVTELSSFVFTFNWQGEARSTWYQIWVGTVEPFETHHQEWYKASDLGCENMGLCEITPNKFFPTGSYEWYVQGWGPGGLSSGGVIGGWAKGPSFSTPN